MVRAGEIGGVLEDSLVRIADQLEKEDNLRRQVRSAMVYPSVVLSVALVVMIVLVVYIVPVFAGVLKEFATTSSGQSAARDDPGHGRRLARDHRLLVHLHRRRLRDHLQLHPLEALNDRQRPQWDALRLKIPFKIGDIVQKISIARWARTFSALTAAGVPLLEALDITGRSAGNEVVARVMDDVIDSVKRGGTISEPLRESTVFPMMVSHMVAVGESTGELDWMLAKIADFYEERVAASVKALTSIIEPVMIVFIGGMVGFIVIAMYLPLFKVYNEVQ